MTTEVSYVDDLTKLSELTETSLVENLMQRYHDHLIYTYCGSILVAMNPFEELDIYTEAVMRQYFGRRLQDCPPHVYSIAEAAMADVRNFRQNQAIVISGESGAGKTESTRLILQYFTTMAPSNNNSSVSTMNQQIFHASTVLESFGNAKTIRNANSSRFGKFVQVHLDAKDQIMGASIRTFLLEKSRVVRFGNTERNYHVFYEMICGASAEDQRKYRLLSSIDDYRYLSFGVRHDIAGVDASKHFDSLRRAMVVLSFLPEEIDAVFVVLSACILLGNVEFDGNEQALIRKKESLTVIQAISELVRVEEKEVQKMLLQRKLVVGKDATVVPLKREQALENRDAIAKTIYDRLFNHLVSLVNSKIAYKTMPTSFIGLLDIFGFENFEVNGFEQLCINYTNEKLQQFFYQTIFKVEQEEYKNEGIQWETIDFNDNQPSIDLIELGIFPLMDEECKVPKGTDATLLEKWNDNLQSKPCYVKPKVSKGTFGIKHYAGEVVYTSIGFMDKNKDAIPEDIIDLLAKSKGLHIAKIFKAGSSSAPGTLAAKPRQISIAAISKKMTTAGSNFKQSLHSLVGTLNAANPHYVRCIKSNLERKALKFDETLVLQQLRQTGMLEVVQVRKAGYALRLGFEYFLGRFRNLTKGEGTAIQKCRTILESAEIPENEWLIGRTKIFLQKNAFGILQSKVDEYRAAQVTVIQNMWRCKQLSRDFQNKRQASLVIQAYYRRYYHQKRFERLRSCVIIVQTLVRGWFARDYYRILLENKRREEAERKAREETERRRKRAEEAKRVQLELEEKKKALLKEKADAEKVKQVEQEMEQQKLQQRKAKSEAREKIRRREDDNRKLLRASRHVASRKIDKAMSGLAKFIQAGDEDTSFLFMEDYSMKDGLDLENDGMQLISSEIFESRQLSLPSSDVLSSEKVSRNAITEMTEGGIRTPMEDSLNSLKSPQIAAKSKIFVVPEAQAELESIQESTNERQDSVLDVSQIKLRRDKAPRVTVEQERILVDKPQANKTPASTIISPKTSTSQITPLSNRTNSKSVEDPATAPEAHNDGSSMKRDQANAGGSASNSSAARSPALHRVLSEAHGGAESIKSKTVASPGSIKSNPLAKRAQEEGEDDKDYFQLYAEENFERHEIQGSLSEPKKSLTDMFTYTRSIIPKPMTILKADSNPELNQMALDCFANLLKVVGHSSRKQDEAYQAQRFILDIGIKYSELHDEIFVQIIRQLTPNAKINQESSKWHETSLDGWHMLYLATACFPASKAFVKAIHYFLKKSAYEYADKNEDSVSGWISKCQEAIRTVAMNGPRKLVPTTAELVASRTHSGIPCKFFTCDEKAETISVHSTTTCADVVQILANRRGLKDSTGWTLFQVRNKPFEEHAFRMNDYLSDIISHGERVGVPGLMKRRTIRRVSKANVSLPNKPQSMLITGDGPHRIYLKKRVFKRDDGIIFDDVVEFELLFQQAAMAFLGEMYPLNERLVLQFASIRYYTLARGKDEKEAKAAIQDMENSIEKYVPACILPTKTIPEWIRATQDCAKLISDARGKTVQPMMQSKLLFLEWLKSFPMHQSSLHFVEHIGSWAYPRKVFLAVSRTGVSVLDANKKTSVFHVPYRGISHWEIDAETIDIHFYRSVPEEGIVPPEDEPTYYYAFQYPWVQDIGSLMKEYHGRVGCERRKGDISLVSETELLAATRNLDKTRMILFVHKVLNVPPTLRNGAINKLLNNATSNFNLSGRQGSFFFDSTHQLSKTGANKRSTMGSAFFNSDTNEEMDWNRVMSEFRPPMLASLLDTPACVEASDKLFQTLTSLTSSELTTNLMYAAVRDLASRYLDCPKLGDEILFQLARFTWEFGDPGSVPSLLYWKLMAVLIGCIKPENPDIIEFLRCHFRRCRVVNEKLRYTEMRAEESKFSAYCYRVLQKSVNLEPRRFVPSKKEFHAVMSRTNLVQRVMYPDRQFRTVRIYPYTRVHDVLLELADKDRLTSMGGVSLFAVTNSSVRALTATEKLCDIIGYWDTLEPDVFQLENPRLTMRRRLFAPTIWSNLSPLEEQFLVAQILDDIKLGKVPLADSDIARLVAIRMLPENGGQFSAMDATELLEKHTPLFLRCGPHDLLPDIQRELITLRDMQPSDANRLLVHHFRQWKYFGSTIYDIYVSESKEFDETHLRQQNFLDTLSTACWLLVNHEGLHFAERNSKTPNFSIEYSNLESITYDENGVRVEAPEGEIRTFSSSAGLDIISLVNEYRTTLGV